ncbi:hypothetical protein PLICRDRAFT_39118 [Plicaturopsis crispa FD-325 SS-3]|nr:hypothetical protein PLICRDRAFT_39118 [Plicaturopsis crispa FD-325 SS-3]
MLGKAEVAKLLDQCGDHSCAIGDVLSAYVYWKYLRGASTTRVLEKLRALCMYLRSTNRSNVLRIGKRSFMAVGTLVASGGGRIGKAPVETPIGIEVWNALRRRRVAVAATDGDEGGPGSVLAFTTLEQRKVWGYHGRWDVLGENDFQEGQYDSELAPSYVHAPSYTSTCPPLPLYRGRSPNLEHASGGRVL